MKSQGEEIQPEQQEKGNNGLAVFPQALPERPAAALGQLIGGEAWNKGPGLLAPLLPFRAKPPMKLFIFSTDGMGIEGEQDPYKQGEAPPQAGRKGEPKSHCNVSHIEGVPHIGIRPIGGKGLVLLNMTRCPQSHCNTEEDQGYTGNEQHFLWFAR